GSSGEVNVGETTIEAGDHAALVGRKRYQVVLVAREKPAGVRTYVDISATAGSHGERCVAMYSNRSKGSAQADRPFDLLVVQIEDSKLRPVVMAEHDRDGSRVGRGMCTFYRRTDDIDPVHRPWRRQGAVQNLSRDGAILCVCVQ